MSTGAGPQRALEEDRGRLGGDPAPVSEHVALQRIVVRMLFDPGLVESLYRDPAPILTPLGISERLQAQLIANDRRLWQADRLRRRRALNVLMEEFKVSTALALDESRRLGTLTDYFSSPEFHAAVQGRGYMALAFAAYLRRLIRDGVLIRAAARSVLALEEGMAWSRRARREAARGRDPGVAATAGRAAGRCWLTTPGVRSLTVMDEIFELAGRVEERLFELSLVPALALSDDPQRLTGLPEAGGATRALLLEPGEGADVEVTTIEADYGALIAAAEGGLDDAGLAAAVAPLGVDRARAREMAKALRKAGVLRLVRVEPDGRLRTL